MKSFRAEDKRIRKATVITCVMLLIKWHYTTSRKTNLYPGRIKTS